MSTDDARTAAAAAAAGPALVFVVLGVRERSSTTNPLYELDAERDVVLEVTASRERAVDAIIERAPRANRALVRAHLAECDELWWHDLEGVEHAFAIRVRALR